MDDQPQSQPFPSPSPPGGGGEEAAKREQEANSETKPKSAVRCNNNNTLFGRHRITAAITRLQNEISIIEVIGVPHLISSNAVHVCTNYFPQKLKTMINRDAG